MSSDVKIWCDGQWPARPMYSKDCAESFARRDGALWPTYEYAWDRAKLAGWKRAGERDQCPACQEMVAAQEAEAQAMADHPDAGGPPYATFNK